MTHADSPAATPRSPLPRLPLLCLGLVLALLPVGLDKPGQPPQLKADEAAYYMMAMSLAHDGDLRLEARDVDRAFAEFPFRPIRNLIAMTDDGWRTVYFGKPYVYSLLAAPFARLLGANGLLVVNLLLVWALVASGAAYLARFVDGGLALLFAAGFHLLSVGFGYAFWLQPEVFNMACVGLSLYFAFTAPAAGRGAVARLAVSGALLAPAVYNKPMLALLGLPALALVGRRRSLRGAATWLAAAALALAALAGLAVALTGHPTPYLGVKRQGVTVCEPGVVPIRPGPGGGAAPDEERPTGGAWSWVFRFPRTGLEMLPANLGYFLVGRHTGLFAYFPFALVALLLFAREPRRGLERWILLASLVLVALAFLLLIPRNWQGGGGFIGNRYYVNAYPAFLFLVRRIRPRALVAAGYGLGGLLLGFLLLSPFARGGPEPTLQSHVRNFPFPLLPLERTLREVPGYTTADLGPVRLVGRSDQLLGMGESAWVRGADRSELWLRSPRPLAETTWLLRSAAPGNRVSLELGGEVQRLELSPGEPRLVTLAAAAGGASGEAVEHRLEVAASAGRVRSWTRGMPPATCPGVFAHQASFAEDFFLGVEILFLGESAALAADVYSARVEPGRVPRRVAPGAAGELPVTVTNTSRVAWEGAGAARVRLASRWLDESGRVVAEGERADLPLPLAAGASARVALPLAAPERPGSYRLRLEPVLEHVAWFADRDPKAAATFPVEVAQAEPSAGAESARDEDAGGEGAGEDG